MTTRSVAEMIAFMVGSKFPDHQWLRDPNRYRVARAQANASELTEKQRLAALAEVEAYETELNAKPAEEVRVLFDTERRRQAEDARRKRQARAEAEERGRSFNRPSARADSLHWSKAAYWSIDEGVALLLGRAPEIVSWQSIRDYADVSPFVRRYAQIRDLALRARESGQLALRTEPRAFLEWAKRTGIAYSCELDEHVRSTAVGTQTAAINGPAETRHEVVTKEKLLLTRERDTVLKMLSGMALGKYGYDPKATRNTAITAIGDDLDAAGVHLDADTIRKWMREAAENLPRDALEDHDQ